MATKAGPTQETTARAKRVALFVGAKGRTFSEIRQALDLTEEQARRAIEVAITLGRVEKTGATSQTRYVRKSVPA